MLRTTLLILAWLSAPPGGTQPIAIVSSSPPNGSIDARQPSNVDGSNSVGWDSIELTFDGDTSGLTPADFTVCSTMGSSPTVDSLISNGNTVALMLSGYISPGAWTRFVHNASGTGTVLGYLPADVDGDGTAGSLDIQRLIDGLTGIVDPPLAIWQCDVARSDRCASLDLLRVIDLLNGAGAFDSWNGVSLGPVPATCAEPEVTLSPLSGSVGTAITVTIDPAVPPLAFDAGTTATWTGVYQPVVGPPSEPFTITYSASQFRETSSASAVLIVGDGSGVPSLPAGGVSPGAFVGSLTLFFAGPELQAPLDFQIAGLLIDWFRIHYPEDEFGYLDEPPSLSAEPLEKIAIYEVSPAGAVPEFLGTAYFYHTACVLLLDENTITIAEAPPTFVVDLVSFDANDAEIDRVAGVTLTQVSNDGDPDHLTYRSDLATPIVVVEGSIDKEQFPGQIILLGSDGGTVSVVETTP